MAKIKLFDYVEVVEDGWWGSYEQYFYIGMGKLSAGVVVPLIEAVADGEQIEVDINSVGGMVFDGWAIYNALIAAKKRGCKIVVTVYGMAASIASIIAMAGDEIVMCRASMLMIHKPTTSCYFFDDMDATALKREAAALDEIQAVLNSVYAARTHLDAAVLDQMIDAETWLSPDKAISLGFADRMDEAVIAEELQMSDAMFTNVFKNADPSTRAYANKSIKINTKMATPKGLKESQDAITKNTEASNAVLTFFTNLLSGKKNAAEEAVNAESELADGTKIYYDGVLGVGTEVFTDTEKTTHVAEGSHDLKDGNYIKVDAGGLVTEMDKKADEEVTNADLEARVAALEAENTTLTNALNASTAALASSTEILTKLKNIKSTGAPEGREQELDKPVRNAAPAKEKSVNLSEMEKRKNELADKNKKK